MSKQFNQKFKEDAVQYYLSHKELGLKRCAENPGISRNALRNWNSAASENAEQYPSGEPRIMPAMRRKKTQD